MNNNEGKQRYSHYLDSVTKRCFDVVVCIVLSIPAAAIIILLAIVVLIFEGRPVFFVQQRAGKKGKLFLMPKIRTLRSGPKACEQSCESDKELFLTVTGGFLRRHRLDELPQIFSVLRGQMSLVGPRPELPNIVATYSPIHSKRLAVKPGITGLWQIKGSRKAAIHKNIKYDLYYLRKASLWLDIKILIKTIPFVLKPEGAKQDYEDRIYTYNVSLSK